MFNKEGGLGIQASGDVDTLPILVIIWRIIDGQGAEQRHLSIDAVSFIN